MKFQDYIVEMTAKMADEFFRYAQAVPMDRVTWTPFEGGRSTLEIAREIALCPGWANDIISGKDLKWDEAEMAAAEQEGNALADLAACRAEFDRRFALFSATVKAFPDARLTDTKWLPFDGGRDHDYFEMMDYPRWNCNYHTGQIAMIQMALGDKAMY